MKASETTYRRSLQQGFTGALLCKAAFAYVDLHKLADAWCNTLQDALFLQGVVHPSVHIAIMSRCEEVVETIFYNLMLKPPCMHIDFALLANLCCRFPYSIALSAECSEGQKTTSAAECNINVNDGTRYFICLSGVAAGGCRSQAQGTFGSACSRSCVIL